MLDDLNWCLEQLDFHVDTDYSDTRKEIVKIRKKYN